MGVGGGREREGGAQRERETDRQTDRERACVRACARHVCVCVCVCVCACVRASVCVNMYVWVCGDWLLSLFFIFIFILLVHIIIYEASPCFYTESGCRISSEVCGSTGGHLDTLPVLADGYRRSPQKSASSHFSFRPGTQRAVLRVHSLSFPCLPGVRFLRQSPRLYVCGHPRRAGQNPVR